MKKLLSILLASAMIFSLGSVLVSCEKDDIREDVRNLLNHLDVKDPEGTLEVNDWDLYLVNGHATLIATYCNGIGLYEPEKIIVSPGDDMKSIIDGKVAIFVFTVPGSYTLSAGSLSMHIKVEE